MKDLPAKTDQLSGKAMSRRRFLRIGCFSTVALGMTLCGVAAMAPDPPPVDLSSHTFGDDHIEDRVLIAYASFAGSTKEVAVDIGKTLASRGFSVDVIPVKEKPSVNAYQFVIIGSAVYGSSWRAEATEFIETNQNALNRVPVAFFSVCLAGIAKDEAALKSARATVYETVRSFVEPEEEVLFAGKVDQNGASLFLPQWLAQFFPTLDFRDWDKIRTWAQNVFDVKEAVKA